MSNHSFYRLLPLLIVLLGYQATAFTQELHFAPALNEASLEDSVVKPTPGRSVQKSSRQLDRVLAVPASGLVKLSGISYNRYKVLDSQGEMWIAGPGTRDQTIDLGHLPTGTYYLYLSTAQGEIVNKVLLDSKAVRE